MPVITQPAPLPMSGAVANAPGTPPPSGDPAPAPVAPVETPPVPAIDPKVMARYERDIRLAREENKKTQAALQAREAEMTRLISPERLKSNFFDVLQQAGMTYDEVVQSAINQPTPDQQRLAQLENEIKSFKTSAEQAQTQAYDQAVNQIRVDATKLVDSNPAYETIKSEKAHNAVVKLIEETYKTDGTLLSVEEAAEQVETFLVEEAIRLASLPKVRARLNPPVQANQGAEAAPPTSQAKQIQNQIKTLTNAATSTSSKPRTAAERRARAIAVARGEALPQ